LDSVDFRKLLATTIVQVSCQDYRALEEVKEGFLTFTKKLEMTRRIY
jgi:hypothetical protein